MAIVNRMKKVQQILNGALTEEDKQKKDMGEILNIPHCRFLPDVDKAWEYLNGREHLYCPFTWEKQCRKCTREKARREQYLHNTYGNPEERAAKGIVDDEV